MHSDDFKTTIQNGVIKNTLLTIQPKPWDSDFFNRKFGVLHVEELEALRLMPDSQIAAGFERITKSADENHYDIIELSLDINQMHLIPLAEAAGFRLVDSRITFITLINRSEQPPEPLPAGTIEYAAWDDFDAIVKLTNESFVDNEHFLSRFKNRRYFSEDDTRRYYKAWIANHIDDPDTHFIVVKDNGVFFAYYIYKKTGFMEGKPVYKAILTAVDPAYRGNRFHMRMQAHLFQQFPEEAFFLDNTSQLTNIPTIRSYIRSRKQLSSIALTFYREKNPVPEK